MDWLPKKTRRQHLLDGDSVDSYKKKCSLARSAQTRTMGMRVVAAWVSYQKFSENLWIPTVAIHIKTDRLQYRPRSERRPCPWRWCGLLIKNFRDRKFLGGDSADSYNTSSLARWAQARAMVMLRAAACIGYQKFSGPKFFGWRSC